MKHRILSLFLFALLGISAVAVRAQETPVQATITAVSGAAFVTAPGGRAGVAMVGQKISVGAVIRTGLDGQLSLETHPGIVAVVAANSTVEVEKLSVSANGMRNALLDLKSGSLASSLDPARKSENNFGIRTAKGLALARGTTLTVTVNGNNYQVAVVAGTVTVNWGGQIINIVGSTTASVTTNIGGVVTTASLGAALAGGNTTTLTEALTAAAAAVATVATTASDVTSVINVIATAAATSPGAAATVASATAAATGAAVTNTTLVAAAGSGGTTAVASTISTAAVTSATAAGNGAAAQLIVTSAVNAVASTISGTNVNSVATALAGAANTAQGNTGNNQINAGQVTAGVNAAQNPATSQGQPVGNGKGNVATTTPITPIDPTINVSPSGG